LPVLWEDNYLELMPGETREVIARFLTPNALAGPAVLDVGGWNIEPVALALDNSSLNASDSQAQ
jgi:hypothetical protein